MPNLDPWVAVDGARVNAACPVFVYRLDPSAGAGEKLTLLPNVQCLSIQKSEGNDPGTATFRYNLAYGGSTPSRAEQALNDSVTGTYYVDLNDRLAVYVTRPDGVTECLFDGNVLGFGATLKDTTEEVYFQAVGIARKLWNTPIGGAIYREPTNLEDIEANTETDLVAIFNEGGLPNRLNTDLAELDDDKTYHVFVDPRMVRDPDVRSYWTIDTAVRYLLYTQNSLETYVINPPQDEIEDILVARVPVTGVAFDYDDLGTYDRKTILAPNLPVTGRDLGGMVEGLIHEHGFGMSYEISLRITGGEAIPETGIKFFSPVGTPKRSLWLQAVGSDINKYYSNINDMRVNRDLLSVANVWEVQGAIEKYEVSVVLAPGFPMDAADGDPGNLAQYDKSNSGFDVSFEDHYRVFVFNEAGDGYYENTTDTLITAYVSLEEVLGLVAHDGTMVTDPALYLGRRRIPQTRLISKDPSGLPRKPRLWISTDYEGAYPGIWDGTGTWQQVTTSEWALLKDRLGIKITSKTPNSWNIGESPNTGDPFRSGIVKVVENLSGASGDPFFLRLTCVIEGDRCVKGVCNRVDTSVMPQDTVIRILDARDRLEGLYLAKYSEFNPTDTEVVVRDDTESAEAEAEARCLATESGVLQGQFRIPYITTYYNIGDRIVGIQGRNMGMRTDKNTTGETPTYPVVTGLRWEFGGGQSTTIEVSDAGSGRFKYSRRTIQERKYAP